MTLRPYPVYRDSGLKWLGKVPAHWGGPTKLGAISSLKGRLGWQGLTADEYREEGPYVVSSAHFLNNRVNWSECPRVSNERYELDDNIQIAAGDILLMKDGAAMGKLAFVDHLPGPACLNSHVLLFRPLRLLGTFAYRPKFAYYFLQTKLFQEYIKVQGTGATFLGVSQAAIARHQVAWPDVVEQESIVDFLDLETAKIDTLIAEQEKLVALLAEKRQATISHTVTRGLDPSVPLKDSGVPWLGEVPAHWSVSSLRRVVLAIEQGWSPECYAREAEVNEWGVLKAGCLNGGVFRPTENKALPPELAPNVTYEVRIGDVLMSRASGSPELVGSTALVTATRTGLMLSDKIFRLRLQEGMTSRYFVSALNSRALRIQIENALSGGNGMANNLAQSNLLAFSIPIPPRVEQEQIAAFVESEANRLDALRSESERAIALLKERRSALITAAVTGQIDVRNPTAGVFS